MEVYDLANIKSAKKRILVSRTRADRNKAIRSGVKTAIKKVYAAIETGDKEAAKAELTAATKTIEMAASKGVYHKNNAARKVSRLSKAVNGSTWLIVYTKRTSAQYTMQRSFLILYLIFLCLAFLQLTAVLHPSWRS